VDLSAIALDGLAQADAQLEAAAASLANAGSASSGGTNADVVDLATALTGMMSAQTLLRINLEVLKTADQIQQAALDVTA
jgi:flagellar hook protein FlgE